MAKLSAHGKQVFRYFDPDRACLTAVMSDGAIMRRYVYSSGWKLGAKLKAGISPEQHRDNLWSKVDRISRERGKNYAWIFAVKSLPSLDTLRHWTFDGVCESVTGDQVEPDGHGPDGAPSWLLALRMI